MQDFEDTESITYPEHTGNWALLVATSSQWSNYRHQADVLAIYQQLQQAGYTDDHIILIAEDDIAQNPSNTEPGVIRVTPGGDNVYAGAEIDYRLSDLQPADFLSILSGKKSKRLPAVVESTGNDSQAQASEASCPSWALTRRVPQKSPCNCISKVAAQNEDVGISGATNVGSARAMKIYTRAAG